MAAILEDMIRVVDAFHDPSEGSMVPGRLAPMPHLFCVH